MKRLTMFLAACFLLMIAGATTAQGAPQQVTDAFADLNRRLQTNYTTANTRWTWSEEVWFNRALGCSRLESTDLPYEEIRGFRVRIDLDLTGAESWDYDYRISYEPPLLILCSPDLDSTPTPTDTPNPPTQPANNSTSVTAAPPLEPTPIVCDASVPPRLRIGDNARVTPGIPNNVRSGAGSSNQYLGEIPPEAPFTVLAGPICASGLAWWQVDYNGLVGWTAEGQDDEYWLEPELASLEPITVENSNRLTVLAELPRPDIATAHLQFQGSSLYVNSVNGITAYQLADSFAAADAMQWQGEVVATLEPSQEAQFEDFVLLDDNNARALYVRRDFAQMWTARVPGMTDPQELGAVRPGLMRLSPDGRYAVRVETASGASDSIVVYDLSSGESWTIQNAPHMTPVQTMTFSPDGQLLVTASADFLIIWEVFAWNPGTTDANQVILSVQGYRLDDVTYVNQVVFQEDGEGLLVSTSDVALNSTISRHGLTSPGVALSQTGAIIWKDVLSLGDETALLGGAYGGEGSLVLLEDEQILPLAIAGVETLTAVRDMAFSQDRRFLAVQTDTRVLILGVPVQPSQP